MLTIEKHDSEFVRKEIQNQIEHQTWKAHIDHISWHIYVQVNDHIRDRVRDRVADQVLSQIVDQIKEALDF